MAKGNVLFIVIDQIRADVIAGAMADAVPLPHLRRFMAGAASFENHFTVTVPCGPARASLLTGLYAMNHRSIRNGTPLARHHATVATEARKAGYEPLLFGYSDTTADPGMHDPSDPALSVYEGVAPGFTELVEMRQETGLEWPAFLRRQDYSVPEPGKGEPIDLYRPVARPGQAPQIRDPALYAARHSDTAYLTDRALEALDVRRHGPWFAHVNFIRPHPPLVAPAPYHRLVDPAKVPPPVAGVVSHPFVDAWHSGPSNSGLFWGFDGVCARLTPQQVADLRAVYLGLAAEVDFHLGRILDWLDETGQRENTLVIVTGDHGEMLGDHGMWGKDSVFDPAWRVPLLVRDPRRLQTSGQRLAAMTESIDLAPTILDWVGLVPPPAMDGVSLLPWLVGEMPVWRDTTMAEIDLSHPRKPTRFQRFWQLPEHACNAAMLREKRWKYVHFNGGIPPMLFDLEADPDETTDLASLPSCVGEVARLARKLLDRRLSRADRRLTGYAFGA